MMQFTQIPENHAPLGDRLLYHFEDPGTGGDHLFQLFDLDTDDALAARRFSRCDKGDVDIAAILRPLVRFTPSVGATGFFKDAGRVSHVQARIDIAYSEERLFLPVMEELPGGTDAERSGGSAVAFGMRTTMPLCRLFAPVGPLVTCVALFIGVDFVTGVVADRAAARREGRTWYFESCEAWRTVRKLSLVVVAVGMAWLLDCCVLDFMHLRLANLLTGFVCGVELWSFLENAAQLSDAPLFRAMRRVLRRRVHDGIGGGKGGVR